MKLTLQLQVLPDAEASRRLRETVERFNAAANWLVGEAFAAKLANKVVLQRRHYRELRESFGLSAQMAVRCIAQVVEAYSRDKSKRPRFRPHAAMPFDQRMMSFKGADRVSLLTLGGRVVVPFVMGAYQRERFTLRKGQSDLVRRRDGKWFLLVTVDVPDGTPLPATDFVGVDLGVANLATTSDGERFGGAEVEAVRAKHARTRRALGKKMSRAHKRRTRKNARRAIKRIGNREARFRRAVNHTIAKSLVSTAKGTGRGIALENLTGIRNRTRFRREQRARLGGWAFHQLRQFVEYKAKLAGVLVVVVDPRGTSRTCSRCGHCEKANRQSQDTFACRACDHMAHADHNAARNIARLGAAVSRPEVPEPHQTLSAA